MLRRCVPNSTAEEQAVTRCGVMTAEDRDFYSPHTEETEIHICDAYLQMTTIITNYGNDYMATRT